MFNKRKNEKAEKVVEKDEATEVIGELDAERDKNMQFTAEHFLQMRPFEKEAEFANILVALIGTVASVRDEIAALRKAVEDDK